MADARCGISFQKPQHLFPRALSVQKTRKLSNDLFADK